MTTRVAWFAGAALAVGALALGPLALLENPRLLAQAATAFALTALPALLTLVLASWVAAHAPDQQLVAGMGGSMLRMAVVLGGGLALSLLGAPETFRAVGFWLWLAGFYLVFLTLEIALLVRGAKPHAGSGGTQ